MSGYALSPDELSCSAQKVDQSSQNIKGMYAHLQSTVQDIGDQWPGDAGTAFNKLTEQLHATPKSMGP
ncbi:WXG100 family type VII secretion target [Streptomyces sp. L2]|uniref:WXG100 family type VII secretion target n=1 Tax=Streptomyces sp. L2 TaxID=2162665 RepID=UPI001011D346|nr:WXG100 family type VII secretion target [Streptomyces sp. L2]